MKRSNMLRKTLLLACGVVLSGVFFASCQKDNEGTAVPVSGLMAFNLAPDIANAGITLSGNSLTQAPLAYTNFTGGYLSVYTGNREAQSYDFSQNTTLATSNNVFEDGKFYSLFLVGANDTYRNIIVRDNFDSLSSTSGKAYIRYINAIPDSSQPQVSIVAGGSNIADDAARFGTVSGFMEVNPGEVAISVNNESNIDLSRTITLEQSKAYTVLLIGLPGATDTTQQTKIRFIENGRLTE
ncbi:MAG: DUF4397 domain-containing protein [Chitinophagaceae bacterium]